MKKNEAIRFVLFCRIGNCVKSCKKKKGGIIEEEQKEGAKKKKVPQSIIFRSDINTFKRNNGCE